jgi:hypothetical protein
VSALTPDQNLRYVSAAHGLALGHPTRRQQVRRRIDTWALYNSVLLGVSLGVALLAVVLQVGGVR